MTASQLIHRVTVQSRAETSDGHDGYTEAWASVPPSRRAAHVRPLAGRDLERARQIDPRASHEITLRYWQGYVSDLSGGRARLIFHDGGNGDRTLELVESPRELEPREALVMLAKEAA